MALLRQMLSPVVDVRKEESATLLLMFLYSFLAMTSYNILKPLTRAQFIDDLGADNLPYVLLVAGILIGLVMQQYTRAIRKLPPKSVIPVTQIGMVAVLAGFWVWFRTGQAGASVGFYFFGLIMGLLLISQFWTLANDIYDPRQAKRLFGFIGGGASLGGMTGSAILALTVAQVGPNNLLLVSAALLALCAVLVTAIVRRSPVSLEDIAEAGEERGVGRKEALQLLRESRHLQVISLIIMFAAMGASLIEQQLNMAVEEVEGAGGTAAIAEFLGQVQFYLSLAGFIIQVGLTSRIHRSLGIGFALLILPVGLGLTSLLILTTSALWAAAVGRVLDSSLRYTVDKTTREILFLPLPADLKYRAKPFVDVTVDRNGKAVAALIMLVLIQPWGLNLTWPRLSYASLVMMTVWIASAVWARRRYRTAFRQTIEAQRMAPAEVRINVADPTTIETLVEELAHPDESRVLYAIDVLESLDKRNLITPLLLHHVSPAVRARALAALGTQRAEIAARWVPVIEPMIADVSPDVRAAALAALATIRNEQAATVARRLLDDADPRIVATAAVALAGSADAADRAAAEQALTAIAADTRERSGGARRDLAAAIRHVGGAGSPHLLIPLLHDRDPEVAEEAMRSVRALNAHDMLFAPTLISLLGHRRLKSGARETLVSYGEAAVPLLGHFLRDPQEDVWVRRHIPATLARVPCQPSIDLLIAALDDEDGFLRYKAVAALEKLAREHSDLVLHKEPVERLALKEGRTFFNWLSLSYNLFVRAELPKDTVLAQLLDEKCARAKDRLYRLLGLLYGATDLAAARWAIERGDARARARALEYLDNTLTGNLRTRLLPVLEDLPLEEKVRRGNVLLRTRPRDVEETMLHLINDDDPTVAAAAIDLVRQQRLWALTDDLEHVLAHRDARDWIVFEAVSWALAARRVDPDRRRQLWLEPLPATVMVDRLRRLPIFGGVSIDEIFRIAGAGRQGRHEAGHTLFHEGATPERVHVLLEGRVGAVSRRGARRELAAPVALGLEQVLDGRLLPETIRTLEPSVSLALTSDELRTLLAANTDLVQGLVRTLAASVPAPHAPPVMRGAAGDELGRLADRPLTPIQKVLALQKVPLFAHVTAAEMLHLAALARQVAIRGGEVLWTGADRPAVCVVLAGALAVEVPQAPDGPVTAGPGDAIGVFEALGGGDRTISERRAVATQAGAVLRIEGDDLLDLLGQRPDLLQQLFAALFGA